MEKLQKRLSKSVALILEKTIRLEANSASCIMYYQPRVPKALENYRRVK